MEYLLIVLVVGWLIYKYGKSDDEVAQGIIWPAKQYTAKKESPTIPDLTVQEWVIADETVEWCKNQIGAFLGTGPRTLPDFGRDNDVLVASYICGFLQGQNNAHRTLERWSSGDDALAQLGFGILAMPTIGQILDIDRALEATKYLPQLGPARNTEAIRTLDKWGGWDGMDHADGESKQKGGLLRHYLEHNVAIERPFMGTV